MNIHLISWFVCFYFAHVVYSKKTSDLWNNSTNETEVIVRNKRIIGEIASTIAVGTFAFNLLKNAGVATTDARRRCVTSVSAVPWEERWEKRRGRCRSIKKFPCHSYDYKHQKVWWYKVQMCTRNYNGEWHRNNMERQYDDGTSDDFYQSEDTLHTRDGTLKWLWFEYSGIHCIKYLTVSCGSGVLDDHKEINLVIGAHQLESLYRERASGLNIQRCGPNNAGVSAGGYQVSMTVPRNVFTCGDSDMECIKKRIFFDPEWVNCYG
jgi:hypothetical protein